MSYMKQKDPKSSVVEEIDRNLRKAFDDVAKEPIPDRFNDLLAQLRAAETSKREKGDD